MHDLPANAASIAMSKWCVYGSNHQELIGLKKEIFGESRYFVDINTTTPRIIDGGAHVGLAALYFKSLWPQAKITCIEPFPENLRYLTYNLWQNHFDDITVIPAALAEQTGERQLFFDNTPDKWFSTAGFIEGAWNREQHSDSIKVATIPLKSLITEPTDIVKLDIEGAETNVLTAAADVLPLIHHLIIEYHPHPNNSWQQLISFLKKHHFNPDSDTQKYPHRLTLIHAINTMYI